MACSFEMVPYYAVFIQYVDAPDAVVPFFHHESACFEYYDFFTPSIMEKYQIERVDVITWESNKV